MGLIKEGESDFKTIFSRIIRRDFSGNTGLAIKNSAYQFSYNVTSKLGSLIFVIILARLILPETFGLYALALSTIMFFYVFSDLGVGQAAVYFSSRVLNNNKKKAKAFITYLLKIKLILSLISVAALLLLAKYISENYYQKPIFLALVAGSIYLFFTSLQSFYTGLAQSNNDFKSPFIKEILLQSAKIILIPVAIIYFNSSEGSGTIFTIFIALSLISILCALVIYGLSIKKIGLNSVKATFLTSKEKRSVLFYILNVSIINSSILLLGNIDKIIIGPLVSPEFIGYYSAAFSLVSASAFLIIFSDVFFPIFIRMHGKKLQGAFRKSTLVTLILSIALFLFIFALAPLIVNLILGNNYSESIGMLRLLSLLAIFIPLIEIYTSYITSKGHLNKITRIISLVLAASIVLPFFLARWMLVYGYSAAIFGLITGILVSKAIHLICLINISRKI